MLEGVPPFAHQTGITLNAEATVLVGSIETILTTLSTLASNQVSGGAEFHAGTDVKELCVDQMLVFMRSMSKIARELPVETHPGVREKFRLPRQGSYLAFLATARSFLDKAGPIKAVFVAHGLPADFDEQLGELAGQLEDAIDDQTGGRTTQVGSTSGLEAKAREGVKLVRRLDGIFSFQFRDDPVRLAEWKSVSHIERPPDRKDEDTPPPAGAAPEPVVTTMLASAASTPDGRAEMDTPAEVEPRVNGAASHGGLVG